MKIGWIGLIVLFFISSLILTGFWFYSEGPANIIDPKMTEIEIDELYGPFIPIYFGELQLRASVADTESERQQGLSGTPVLPTGIVKLFIFESPAVWGFWMKGMNYPIDIIWLDADKKIIHVAANLAPETYPTSFLPPVDSLYVIETPAGQAEREQMVVGAKFTW